MLSPYRVAVRFSACPKVGLLGTRPSEPLQKSVSAGQTGYHRNIGTEMTAAATVRIRLTSPSGPATPSSATPLPSARGQVTEQPAWAGHSSAAAPPRQHPAVHHPAAPACKCMHYRRQLRRRQTPIFTAGWLEWIRLALAWVIDWGSGFLSEPDRSEVGRRRSWIMSGAYQCLWSAEWVAMQDGQLDSWLAALQTTELPVPPPAPTRVLSSAWSQIRTRYRSGLHPPAKWTPRGFQKAHPAELDFRPSSV